MLKLYHGTDLKSAKQIYKKIEVTTGSRNTDFGLGFYTTDDYDKAKSWANHKSATRGEKPAIVTIIFDEDEAKSDSVIKYFSDDLNWGRFIINNRNGMDYVNMVSFKEHNLDAKYDITIGRIADIDVSDVAEELMDSGDMLDATSLARILNKKYPQQVVFHTENSLKYIKRVTYRAI